MHNTNNQMILKGFLEAVLAAPKQIKYNPQFMDHKARVERDEINFINVISHPKLRIVLRAGEFAVTRATHPNPRFVDSSNVILVRGTQYGAIAMFGIESQYSVNEKTRHVSGPVPRLHAGRAFLMAADRHFKRKGVPFNIMHHPEQQLLEWIFSPTFAVDLAEQAKLDKAAGIALGDGLPPKPPRARPDAKKKVADTTQPPSNDAKFERRARPREVKTKKVA